MPTPPSVKLINGMVFDIYGVSLAGSTVTVTIIAGSKSVTTDSDGKYIVNLADIGSWNIGDTATITATKTAEGSKTETLTLNSSGGQTQNITLDEEVEYPTYTVEDSSDRLLLRKNMLVSYDNRDINHSNPLPVEIMDRNGVRKDNYTEVFTYNTSNLVEYHGRTLPGSSKSSALWQIKKYIYSGTNITDIQFAQGNDKFDKVWDNYLSYSYS